MGEVNLSRDVKNALDAIDRRQFDEIVHRIVNGESSLEINQFRLWDCGEYVSNKYDYLGRALTKRGEAKSNKKWNEADDRVRRAASDLIFAIRQMKDRREREEKEAELFYVFDDFFPPSSLHSHMSVLVRYRWRAKAKDNWSDGSIEFHHVSKPRPQYGLPVPKRKPSVAKQRELREAELSREWEDLMRGAVGSVHRYLQKGMDGSAIPETFQVKVDSHTGMLNNFSTKFWDDEPKG